MAENAVCSLSPSCPFDQGPSTRVAAKMMALPAALHTLLPCAHLPTRVVSHIATPLPYIAGPARLTLTRLKALRDVRQATMAGCKARRGQEARCKAEQEKVGPSVSDHPHCQYMSPRTPSFKDFPQKTRWARRRGCRFPESNAVRLSKGAGGEVSGLATLPLLSDRCRPSPHALFL